LEAVVRHLTATLILIGSIGLGTSALARDIYFAKQTPEALKAVCDKVGGRFTQDPGDYECATDCNGKPGTACTVFCKPDQKCVAQVTGGRRPHTIESALQKPTKHRR
jgi:hypothetical protein